MLILMKRTLKSRLARCTINTVAALSLIVVALSMPWRAEAQQTATARAPARIAVSIPRADSSGMAMLEVVVSAFRKPAAGNIGGVVRLKGPGGAVVHRLDLGRGAALSVRCDARVKQLGVAAGSAEVEVALIDRSNGVVPPGTELQLGHVQISMR